ncbi:DUF1772 domain-containing protein [Leifsonia sp. NPDC058292]|uniref:anthrone oxygenase family protein n=1 Tax=Leifsonia sp. NPDC058292 TaxID=3346428 RepID=UPI0036D8992A
MTDQLIGLLVGLAALTTATAGGVYLGFTSMVMPALRESPEAESVATMNRINVRAVRSTFMIAFVGSALTCLAVAIVVTPALPRLDALFALLGAALGFIAFVVTAAVNVPLNNRLAATKDGRGFADFERRWRRGNSVRGAVSLLGAASLITSLVV